jgi:ABC-type uncharacterized transport system ATPase subunit
LLGENGAGKSTLMHVAFGMIPPDRGTIAVNGRRVRLASPRDARRLGIGMVHQHFTSIESLTVRENLELAIGRRTGKGPFELPSGLLAGLAPDVLVEELGVALRQRLEIAKALGLGAEVLLLDEPSAVLAPSETEELLALVRGFARGGGAVAFITHKLPEVFSAADRVTVLRQGRVTRCGMVRDQTERILAEAMIGEPLREGGPPAEAVPGTGPEVVRIGEITIRPGELVGIAAIEGQGQRELLRRIAGVPLRNGTHFSWNEVQVTGPVGFVPEDRTTEGLIPDMSVAENLVLGREDDSRWRHGIWLRWKAARAHAEAVLTDYQVVAPGVEAPVSSLSGGNQQKLVVARALESRPRVLVAENPVRGLDIKASEAIQERLRAAAGSGVAVLVYSTDLDEVLSLASRVLVVRGGRATEAPGHADRRTVGQLMLGVA